MKKTLLIYSIGYMILIISVFVVSLIISALRINNTVDNKTYDLVLIIATNIIFIIVGLIVGLKVKSKGLLHGFMFALIYTIFVIIFNILAYEGFKGSDLPALLIKDGVLILSTLIGVNLRKR